jgi:hypothetical protein
MNWKGTGRHRSLVGEVSEVSDPLTAPISTFFPIPSMKGKNSGI